MSDVLKNELREGEKLLWTGTPEKFETLDLSTKIPFIKRAILICAIVIGVCAFYIAATIRSGTDIKPMLIAILVLCGLLGSFSFYFDAKKLRRAVYAITDQHLIMIVDIPKYVELSKIRDVEMKEDSDGHVSLLCGKNIISTKEHKWRSLSLVDPYIDQETGLCERFIFYAIPEAGKVRKILRDFLPL